MTCTRRKSKYVRKDVQHECHSTQARQVCPFHVLQLLSSSICVQLTRRAIKASRPLSLKSAIGVQLPKQQLPGLRRQNSNFPFSILLPPSPSTYTIRFMILLHLRILRCRYQCRCPTDLWRNEPFRLLAPSALPRIDGNMEKRRRIQNSNKGRRDREQWN